MSPAIPTNERPAVWRLFAYCLMTGASYTLARTAADSLFLSRVGNENLAMVFVAAGFLTAIVASMWFLLIKRFSLERFLRVSTVGLGFLSILACRLLPSLHHSFYCLAAIYVLAEIKGCINAINVISAMNETLGGHSSRHSWAGVLLGFPLAAAAVGLLIGIESSFVSVGTWLLIAGTLDLLAVLPTIRLLRHQVPKPPKIDSLGFSQRLNEFSLVEFSRPLTNYVCTRKFTQWIGILIAAKVIVLTMVAFEWKVTVNNYYGGDEQALARYFGIFYAIAGLATLVVQFFLTGKILTKKSVLVPILILPLVMLALNTFIVLGSSVLFLFVVTTIAKSMDAWRRSTHDTALHFLYTKIEKDERRGLIARNHSVIKPVAEVTASLILLFGSQSVHQWVLMAATLIWIFATAALIGLVKRSKPAHFPN